MKGVKFNKGDKIFAKVRGYPPWPAKVEAVADETPSKMKYHVYFFGTAETAIVKAEDICLYGPNRAKLGKRKKHKNFAEAMEQIEASLTAEERAAIEEIGDEKLDESKASDQSRLDESKVSLDDSALPEEDDEKKKKAKVPIKKDRKRKLEEEPEKKRRPSTAEKEPKRQKTEEPPEEPEEQVEPKKEKVEVKEEPKEEEKKEILSRSGRKIKPKRYLDEEEDEKDSKDFLIAKKDGTIIKIPLNLNKPKFTERYESEWSKMVLEHATALKKRIESGEFKENAVSHMDEWTKAKSEEISERQNSDATRILDTEMDLLDTIHLIKSSLTLEAARCDKAIEAFDTLDRLSVTPLMLKKNPDVVYAINKILKYKGNNKEWKLPEEELVEFEKNAEILRQKANHIFNKMVALFLVPANQDFMAHFQTEVENFNEKYGHLGAEDMVNLASEE